MAKVDILLPYWGEFSLLKKAVDSIIGQTEDDWRLLIFDDCYPSLEANNYFAKNTDKRIFYTRHKKNIGITNNFNFALKAAKAGYCVMMGCDDVMLPNYLERALENIGVAAFYQPGVRVIDGDDRVYLPLGDRVKKFLRPKKPGVYSGERLAVSLCRGNWLYFPSILWRTKTIKKYGFSPEYVITQDVLLELSMIKDGAKLCIDNEETFQYRRFANSVSSVGRKDGKRFVEEAKIYNYLAKEFAELGWLRAARSARLRITSRLHQALSNN